MDKFSLSNKIWFSQVVNREIFIQQKCKDKNVLDLGCIRHDASFASNPTWLHNLIRKVAKSVIGIDYLETEVKKLQKLGYNIIHGDVTKPLKLQERFDVIVAGDLIEHLTNFEGFFKNCTKYLDKDGILILSTPNPFYFDEFLYVGLNNTYFVNPKHTCWIDPLLLNQLVSRFDFIIQDLHFIKQRWLLESYISETPNHRLDILKGKWIDNKQLSKIKKIKRLLRRYLISMMSKILRPLLSSKMRLLNYSDYIAVLKVKNIE